MKILGVYVGKTLSFSYHVTTLIEKVSRSFYALKTLRAHGLVEQNLWDVTRATVVAQLLYASPAWWGFLNSEDKTRLESVLTKAQRYGYLPTGFSTLDELREKLDDPLFHSSRYNPYHVLHQLLPPPKDTGHDLRKRSHNLTLPTGLSYVCKQNFVNRMLFTDIY